MRNLSGIIILALYLPITLTSCNSIHKTIPIHLTNTYCSPSIIYHYDTVYLPKSTSYVVTTTDTSLSRHYSQHDLLLANATGILPLLNELVSLVKTQDSETKQLITDKQQQIVRQLLLASTQIAGIAAELDCEGEQADQLATYLDQLDTRRIRRLTILSVIVGAATTVASALIQNNSANKATSIGGGIISAGFGGLAAFSSNRLIELKHQRNLLADIWNQPNQSLIYPPMIWYVLNEQRFSNMGKSSLSFNLRQRWQQYVINNSSGKEINLFFGEGGAYTSDDLHSRANMLNQLQSTIRSINQDLQSLIQSVSLNSNLSDNR